MTGSFVMRTEKEQEAYRIDSIAATDNSFDFYAVGHVDRHTRIVVFGMINDAFKYDMNTLEFAQAINIVQKTILKLNGFDPDELDDVKNITIH